MNFLAHYFFDRIQKKPAYSLGLLMPDFLRNFIPKGSRAIHTLPINASNLPEAVSDIISGAEKHHQSDKFFHNCKPFVQLNEQIINNLRNSKLGFHRDWFLAHIYVELMLDRIILQKHPFLSGDLYEDLTNIPRHHIEYYLRNSGIEDTMSFFSGFNRFLDARYLDTYTDADSIAYAMSRIALKMNIDLSENGQKIFLRDMAIEMEPQITNFMHFLNESRADKLF